MEKQLFTWGSWDLCDNLFIAFMNCVFIKDIGKYKAGDKVYYNNRDKSLILAVIGKEGCKNGVRMAAAHIDSPRLDLKPYPMQPINLSYR